MFDKLLQLLRFGCSYEAIADTTRSATTIRNRRDEWIRLGVFAQFKQLALEAYDRIVGLVLEQIAVDGAITKAPGGGEAAGRSPVDRGKQGMKRSGMTDGYGIPLGRVLAGANRHVSPLLAPTLDLLSELGPLPDDITVHLDAGYDSAGTRSELNGRGLHGQIAHKGEKAPIQASQRWHVERTHAWQNAFHRLARCYERRTTVINACWWPVQIPRSRPPDGKSSGRRCHNAWSSTGRWLSVVPSRGRNRCLGPCPGRGSSPFGCSAVWVT